MTKDEAKSLIEGGLKFLNHKTSWADLGCGAGLFTNAIADLLFNGSKIYAIDRESQTFDFVNKNVEISFIKSNMEDEEFPFQKVDGMVMANSLHYIQDQKSMIRRLRKHLNEDGRIILVEYDTDQSNQWVPYPINFNKAITLFTETGFKEVIKIGERQSIYRKDKMYACLIR